MDIKEAAKKVRATKPKENLMLIRLTYSQRLILPYSQGLAFMAALENAEILEEEYGKNKVIKHMLRDSIEAVVLSRTEYEQIKIANLLGVSFDDIKEHNLEIA